MEVSKGNQLTEGSILKSIILLTIPILIGNLLQVAFQITDTFWVGRLGKDAVASVSICFPILFFVMAISGGVGLAGGIFVSQYKGSKNQEKVDHVTGQTLLMATIISLFFSVIGYFLAPYIIMFFGTSKEVFSGALSYIRISFIGMVFVFGFMVYQSLSRAVGDAKTPVYILLFTVILNLVFDPLFIFGYKFIPALGVAGAAIATIGTQSIAFIAGIIILSKGKKGIHLKLRHFKPDYDLMRKIISQGIPISLEQSSRSIGFIFMNLIAASFGTIILASYGIGTNMISLVILPALSLSIANSALIGQNIGAGKIQRAQKIAKTSTILGFIILTIIGILFFIFSSQLIALFIPNETEVIKQGSLLLKIISLTFGLIGIQFSIIGTLRGSGNSKTTFKLAVLIIIIQVTSAFLLSKIFALNELGLWLSFPISNTFGAIIAYFIFKKGRWKEKKLIESKEIKENIKEECKISECDKIDE